MDVLKKFFVLGLCFGTAAWFAACDVDDEASDADAGAGGASGGAGGAGGAVGGAGGATGGAPAPVYVWVTIEDASDEVSTSGTPGVDICGVSFVCPDGGPTGHGIEATLLPGNGDVCNEGEADCSADRDLPEAATGPIEDPCEAGSAPSHYVAIGQGGLLNVKLGVEGDAEALATAGGLMGCEITVAELAPAGSTPESYKIYVCEDLDGEADGDKCIEGAVEVPEGGDHTFTAGE